MNHRRLGPLLLLIVALAAFSGCSKPKSVVATAPSVSLDLVRQQSRMALDNSAPSGQRAQARDEAMSTLVAFLKMPESVKVSQADWEKPLSAGANPLIRYFESGPVRVYAVTLPGSGIVPPGERVAVQYIPGSGAPQAYELTLTPGSRLLAARYLDDGGQGYLTLALAIGRDGGLVAHLQRETRTGEFKPYPTSFKGLPATIGAVSLDVKEGMLLVSGATAGSDPWQPSFDTKHPLRLYLNGDIGLDWKNGGFVLLDERNFNVFQGLNIALDPKAKKEDRAEAWDKTTRKLPDYLRDVESWGDELTGKLPAGGRVLKEQMSNLAVRLVSVPAPDFAKEQGLTVVQQRASGGMPSAQVLPLPGVMEGFRLVDHQGLPALLIVSNSTSRANTGPQSAQKTVSLYRLTAGNTWEPASDWFGFLPTPSASLQLDHTAGSADLNFRWNPSDGVNWQVAVAPGTTPAVQVCATPQNCNSLAFTADGHLSGATWVQDALRRIVSGSVPAPSDVTQATTVLQQYLATSEALAMPISDLGQVLGVGRGVEAALFAPDPSTRVVGLPPNTTGIVPVIIQTAAGGVVDTPQAGTIVGWVSAKAFDAGGSRWLALLGRAPGVAVVQLYKWAGNTWTAVDALPEPLDRMFGLLGRITYVPGQKEPVRGLVVHGSPALSTNVSPDGSTISFCESDRTCVTYQYENKWVLK